MTQPLIHVLCMWSAGAWIAQMHGPCRQVSEWELCCYGGSTYWFEAAVRRYGLEAE